MIVGCPECSTDFRLPTDKIPDKGAKVRCSKCGHTFRVRVGGDGEPEIFYDEQSVADPPTQELGDLFDEDDGNRTQLGSPTSDASSADEEVSREEHPGSRTQIGKPSAQSESASAGYNPFPLAGVVKTGKVKPSDSTLPGARVTASDASSDEVNIFDEGEATVVTDPEADPFGDAFEGEEAPEEEGQVGIPGAADVESFFEENTGAAAPPAETREEPEPQPQPQPEPEVEAEEESPGAEEKRDVFSGQGRSEFGNAEDFVDPSFGMDGPVFDASTGQVERPTQGAARASAAAGAEPKSTESPQAEEATAPKTVPTPRQAAAAAAARSGASTTSAKPAQESARRQAAQPAPTPAAEPKRSAEPTEWEVAPHEIGGSGWRKLVNFLFLMLVVLVGFLAVVAGLNDWHLDFANFPHMLEVAFEDKEYEPREEWAPPPPPAPPVEQKSLEVANVYARLVPVGKRGKAQVLLIQGDVRNVGSSTFEDVAVRTKVLDEQGKVLREETTQVAVAVDHEALADLDDPEDAQDVLREGEKKIAPGEAGPFALVFPDVPQTVLEGGDVQYTVEVIRKSEVE